MPRETRFKIKVNGDYREVVPGKSPAVLDQEKRKSSLPKVDVTKLPDPKELRKHG